MNREESFSMDSARENEGDIGLKEKVQSYIAQEAHEKGIASLEAAFKAAFDVRVQQLEAIGLDHEEALKEVRLEYDAAEERRRQWTDS